MARRRWSFVAVAVVAALGLLAPAATATAPYADIKLAASANSIPDPKSYFGFSMGAEGRLATHDKMVSYLKLAADKSNRVDFAVAGEKTPLGQDYPYLTISSPANLNNLNKITQVNQRLSDPRGLSEEQARQLAKEGKPILLIQSAIHSTEVGNTQALMDVVYRLATEESDYTKRVLDNAVLLVVPSQNPDGEKLVNDYFNETANTDFERTYPDLYHKYTGHDDNRDWFMFTQPEVRNYINLVARFRPAMVYIMHQMGRDGDRIFTPPYKDPFDPSIDPRVVQTTSELGLGMAGPLTRAGKKGVSWSSTYDWWLPSVFYEPYHGIPNVLTELASVKDLAYTYKSADGKPLGSQEQRTNFVQPYDSDSWTLQQIVEYAKIAAYANIDQVGKKSESLLYNLYEVSRDNIAGKGTKTNAYVFPAGQRDPYAAYELLNILSKGQIELQRATAPFTAGGKQYAAGSYVVSMKQPYSRWADALLKIWEYPELRACGGCPLIQPYDVTGHTLWMLFGAEVDAVDGAFDAKLEPVAQPAPEPSTVPAPAEGGAYLVEPDSYGIGRFLAAVQKAGVTAHRAAEKFTAGGTEYAPGTLVVKADATAQAALAPVAKATGIQVALAAETPDVPGYKLKDGTRIGLYRGINNMPGGWLWWLFEQYGVNSTNMVADDFTGDLRDKYDTIVLPQGITKAKLVDGLKKSDYPDRFHWAAGIGEDGWQRLKDFVEDGGTLVALGNASKTATDLLGLPVKNPLPNPGEDYFIPGSLIQQKFDPSQPVAWGMPEEWPVWFQQNDAAFEVASGSGARVAAEYPSSGDLLRSGYAAGGERLHGLADVASFDVGKGDVTIAGSQVSYRTWSRATITMLFNAMYNGPAEKVDSLG